MRRCEKLVNSNSNPIEIQPDRLKNLLRELVNIYSPSGKEEEILEYTEQYLRKTGFAGNPAGSG